MKAYMENSMKHQHFDNSYSVGRELGGRLTVLSGLIGSPHWQMTDSYDRQRAEAAVRRSQRIRSRAFTGAVGRGAKATWGLVRKAAGWYGEYRALNRNVAELNGLDERTLRDIGVFRGDIAAIASKTITVGEINRAREEIGQPGLKLVTSRSVGTVVESEAPKGRVDLPREAA